MNNTDWRGKFYSKQREAARLSLELGIIRSLVTEQDYELTPSEHDYETDLTDQVAKMVRSWEPMFALMAEYKPDQWWVPELESILSDQTLTPDQKRSIAVVLTFFRKFFAIEAKPPVLWCSNCNSQRPRSLCWKCEHECFPPAKDWPLPKVYDFGKMQEWSKAQGYNLVQHGSGERDQDLVAIPWTDEVTLNPVEFSYALAKHIGGTVVSKTVKPHSRFACSILPSPSHKLIDLSVIPPKLAD